MGFFFLIIPMLEKKMVQKCCINVYLDLHVVER